VSPEDSRHGTSAGYIKGCRDDCCLRAKVTYDKRRRWELHATGQYRKVPSYRSERRLQALQRLGWSIPTLAKRLGVKPQVLYSIGRQPTTYRSTFDRIARLYDELHMTFPPTDTPNQRMGSAKARNYAARQGWVAPLGWDNIDDPNETPDLGGHDDEIDEVVIQQLTRLRTVPSNRAEKVEALRRWLHAGNSEASICAAHGWKQGRYTGRLDEAFREMGEATG